MAFPLFSFVTSASQTWVVRPAWVRRAAVLTPSPTRAVPLEIRFELDRGEAGPAVGQGDETPIAAGAVGERDDAGRVQESVGGDVVGPCGEASAKKARARLKPFKPKMIGEAAFLALGQRADIIDFAHVSPRAAAIMEP